MRRAEVLARIHAYWEPLIRPALREQAERMTAHAGRRPAPGELVAIAGETDSVRDALRPGVPLDLGQPMACVVSTRAREASAHRVLREDAAACVTAGGALLGATGMLVAWVEGSTFAVEILADVVDTGPEGGAIHAPGARRPS